MAIDLVILSKEDEPLATSLGVAVARRWNQLPPDLQTALITHAWEQRRDVNPSLEERLKQFVSKLAIEA